MRSILVIITFIIVYTIASNGPLFKDIYHREWEPKMDDYIQTQIENAVNYFTGENIKIH